MNKIIFGLLSLGVIISSVLVITSKNPVIAVIFLISLFMNMAVYLIWSSIGFVGLSYILIYIGAITVLFLFIIMMINIKLVDILETGYQYTKNLPLAILVGILFIFIIYSILPFTINNTYILNKPFEIIQNLNTLIFHVYSIYNLNSLFDIETYYFIIDIVTGKFIQIKTLGQGLYSYGAIWLLITSIILLLAMLSAIILSKKF